MPKAGSQNPEIPGNWQGTAGLPQFLSYLIGQIKQNSLVLATAALGKQKLELPGMVLD